MCFDSVIQIDHAFERTHDKSWISTEKMMLKHSFHMNMSNFL
jgi:hypothetical protein